MPAVVEDTILAVQYESPTFELISKGDLVALVYRLETRVGVAARPVNTVGKLSIFSKPCTQCKMRSPARSARRQRR